MSKKKKVIIRRSPDYNPEIIKKIVQEGLSEFGLSSKAKEKITIKPNVVMAHHKIAPSAFTRPEFLDGLLGALTDGKKDRKPPRLLFPTDRSLRGQPLDESHEG